MALKKAVFHPFERLDVVDVDALQDLSHNAMMDLIGGLAGRDATGVLTPWLSSSVSSTGVITFGDFTFLGSNSDAEGHGRNKPSFMGKFTSSAAGECSAASFQTQVQTYYNTNGFLPPAPGTDSYDVSLHGDYYPYIYCRPVVQDGESATRRFWSVGDNAEVSEVVNTRTVTSFEFLVEGINQFVSAPESGYPWTRVAKVTQWTVSGGVVSLRNIHVVPWTLSETLLGVEEVSGFGSNGGLHTLTRWLTGKLTEIQNGGSLDNVGALDQPLADAPQYSLTGLQYELDTLSSTVDALPIPYHASMICQVAWSGGTYPTLSYTGNGANDFSIVPYLDYKGLRAYIATVTGTNVNDLSGAWNTYVQQSPDYAHLINTLAISIPSTLANLRYELSVTPLWSESFASDGGYYDASAGANSYNRYRALMSEQEWQTIIASNSLLNQPNVITAYSRQTLTSSEDVVFYGVKIGERGIKTDTFANLALNDRFTFRFRVSLTVYRT